MTAGPRRDVAAVAARALIALVAVLLLMLALYAAASLGARLGSRYSTEVTVPSPSQS